MINYIIDMAYAVIVLITVVVFVKRGFIESVFKYGKTLFAGVIAYAVGPVVSKLIYEKYVYNGIYSWVLGKVNALLGSTVDKVDVDTLSEHLPVIVQQFIRPEDIKSVYGETVTTIEVSAQSFSSSVSVPLSSVISNMIGYVLVFLAAVLLLSICGKLLDFLFKLPVLKTVNSILGLLLGIGAAFLLLSAITYGISVLIGFFGDILSLQTLSENSYMFGFFDKIQFFNLH